MFDMTKTRVLTSLATLAASGAICSAALASSQYTVKIKLPADAIAPGHAFKVKGAGVSPSRSRLTEFLSGKSCAASSKAEALRPAQKIINKNVAQSYTSSKNAKASQTTGTYYVCAYLTQGSSTRAHQALKYFVVVGGY
jgi:hypothetical protein